tara:strand:+ start:75698 stop:76486 length:789 start_codon:yes stop_codon:yes gene_type:complete
MKSKYLNKTTSIEELDKFLAEDRRAAIELAEITFQQASTLAIHKVAEINLVSGARIQADCNVLSAKIASSAEICSTELLASAEIATQKINSAGRRDELHLDQARSMIMEIGRQTERKISDSAKRAIEDLHAAAAASIKKITEQAKVGIQTIEALVEEVSHEVIKRIKIAKTKLDETKQDPRTAENAKENAADAKALLDAQSNHAMSRLKEETRTAVDENGLLVEQSIKHLRTVADAAEQRIITARDAAILKLKDILSRYDSK